MNELGEFLATRRALLKPAELGLPAAWIQRVVPARSWTTATVTVTGTVADPVTSSVTGGPAGSVYALSGDLGSLLAGAPGKGFTLTRVAAR